VSAVQATVFDFNDSDGSGTVVLDDGHRLPFSSQAFAASGLRMLRPGQRVRLELSPTREVEWLTIATLPPCR
jgi:cold shock CspA family protein